VSAIPTWAALESLPDSTRRLVVVERVSRGGDVDDGEIADWVRDGQRLATLEHPNVARVRDVVIGKDDVTVVSDFVDGVRWADLASGPKPVPLEIALRIFVDALSGLSAIHNVRDAKREPLKLVHGRLTTECIVVGLEGVTRIIGASRVRSGARPEHSGSAYLAPEVLLADDAADARADVYSIGVMLWEALSGRPLFPNTQASAIVTALLSGRVPRAEPPKDAPWAAPLADTVSRALAVDPEKRFASASALGAELRRIAGVKLVPPLRVAALVRAGFGEQVKKRREELERGEVAPREAARAEAMEIPVDLEAPSSSVPAPAPSALTTTRPPPPLTPVMSSEPPTQPRPKPAPESTEAQVASAAIVVPPAPQVPKELAAAADPPEVPSPVLSLPGVPAVVEPEASPVHPAPPVPSAPSRRSKARVYAAVAVPLGLVLVGIAAWLLLGGSSSSNAGTAAPAASVAPSSPPAASAAPAATAATEVARLAPLPEPTASAARESAPSVSETSKEAPASPSSTATAGVPPGPAPVARPRAPIIKYDPQGI